MARPLALELINHGLKIWYDEFSLHIGDSLSASIDRGLSLSDYGIVVISKNFFEKNWPQQEVAAFITKQVNLNKRVILPIWHNISKEEIQKYSSILVNAVAAKTTDGIKNIADTLYKEIRGIRKVYDFSSDAELKNDISSLSKSIEKREALLKEAEEELVLVILMKIYLIANGYRHIFIYLLPFSELLSSNTKVRERLNTIIAILIDRKFVVSKALGTISITHQGIKKIEELLEKSYIDNSTSQPAFQFLPSLGEFEKSDVLKAQKLRYDLLKQAHYLSSQKSNVNLFEIGELLGVDKESLGKIYFYLEDEGLINFYALGGSFFITKKGKELIEKRDLNRIF